MDQILKAGLGRHFHRDCKLALFKITSKMMHRILVYFKDVSKKKTPNLKS